MIATMIAILIASLSPSHDYGDGWTDGYCQAIADTGHGWRIDEVPHSPGGFACVWSIPAHEGDIEACSDSGGYAWQVGDRLVCQRFVNW